MVEEEEENHTAQTMGIDIIIFANMGRTGTEFGRK